MNTTTLKYYFKLLFEGLLNSFTQIYFSNNKIFAVILLLVTFFDFGGGFAAILAVLISQTTALFFNFDHKNIRNGTYTYNSAMVGVAIGIFYQFNASLLILIVITSILTFFLTIWFFNQLAVKGLPFLSIPFLLVTWLVILGGRNFSALELHEKTALSLVTYLPFIFNNVTEYIAYLPFADVFYLYFRSLGAILFQYNDLAGIIIAFGLLLNSRISFVLSLYGFILGFIFYRVMEADFSQLIYSYIGFNFILTAIALGGFFIIASRRSFVLLLFCIPMIAIIISGTHGLFQYFNLPLYSLPFNIVVLMVLYAINQRLYASKLYKVFIQHFSPEKNHYKHFNSLERFSNQSYVNISLPIIGFWRVSQGNNGSITHKDDYKYALDFDVINENGKTYENNGLEKNNYYCFNLPVVAPASGIIATALDGIDDNQIGDVDIANNWGNTVVIKHTEYLYSKLSHLKKGSLLVKPGDFVYKGQVIANCGSSGRSPEPHLHFQLQSLPYIASKTLLHPIDYYLTIENNIHQFHSFDIPKENELVSNVTPTKLLSNFFNLIPGKILTWNYTVANKTEQVKWEVFVDSGNLSYLYCHKTGATAYFVNNGTVFFFTDFYGKTNSLLHHFYKGVHKVILGYYPNIEIKDQLLITDCFNKGLNFIHDFTAPFFHYLKSEYHFSFTLAENPHQPTDITFNTTCSGVAFNKEISKNNYEFIISEEQENSFSLKNTSKPFKAVLCTKD
ncbi:MAG: urea transporter [Bacteroidetes bacterium]|nr:urea transporter [Bacteroidota bacterium]